LRGTRKSAIVQTNQITTNNKTKKEKTPMKTTTTIIFKTGLLVRYLRLLAAVAVFVPHCVWASDPVPFKGSAEGAIVSASPDPGGLLVRVLADGDATQLGRLSREEVLLLNPSTGAIAGTIVFTAANGDRLLGTVAGQFISPTTVAGTYTLTGGTGRFQNASGEADFSLSTSDGVHFAVKFDGSLSSVGAN
jgi:hypothetical protein